MLTLQGTIAYIRDVGGKLGEDQFTTIRTDNGSWTVQARTQTSDTCILRDVVHVMDDVHRPLSSHIVQWHNGARTGDGWFLADSHGVNIFAWLRGQGLIRQRIDTPSGWPAFIVPHAVVCDAFICARYDRDLGGRQHILGGVRSSPRADGATGPLGDLMTNLYLTHVVTEDILVRAGRFTTHRFLVERDDGATELLWVTDPELLLVRLRSDQLASTYELQSLTRLQE